MATFNVDYPDDPPALTALCECGEACDPAEHGGYCAACNSLIESLPAEDVELQTAATNALCHLLQAQANESLAELDAVLARVTDTLREALGKAVLA